MSDKLKAARALAEAVREIIEYDEGCAYIYGRADSKVAAALADFDAATAEASSVCRWAGCESSPVKGQYYCVDHIDSIFEPNGTPIIPKPTESQAAGEWIERCTEEVLTGCTKELLTAADSGGSPEDTTGKLLKTTRAIIAKHAPPNQSQQLAAAQARVADLEKALLEAHGAFKAIRSTVSGAIDRTAVAK